MENKKLVTLLVVIAVLAGGVIWYIGLNKTEEPVLSECSMEALACPDGSYVGRSGPTCAFKACPNQASFVGMLRQDINGYSLLVGAPEKTGMQVSYSIPLTLDVTNALANFVGKRVEVFGDFTTGNTLAINHLGIPQDGNTDPTLVNVKINQSMFANGVKITVNKLVEDSRCPEDVNCIQAGRVVVSVDLKSDTDSQSLNISSAGKQVAFDSYKVSLESVLPNKFSKTTITESDYVLTFKVVANLINKISP